MTRAVEVSTKWKAGTSDLRGRFLVGKADYYGNIGDIGGSNHVRLSVNEMPRHTHFDTGHSHYNDFRTSHEGNHDHAYKDVFWSESMITTINYDLQNDFVNVPGNYGQDGKTDVNNMGWQMDRRTFHGGDHSHAVAGWAHNGNAILTETGNEGEHENRPPFTVIQYIMFIQK